MSAVAESDQNTSMTAFEAEIAAMIVDALRLPDIRPHEIESSAPLYREGLGLDSIDILELALAIQQRYGVQIRSDDQDNTRVFSSLTALAKHIHDKQTHV